MNELWILNSIFFSVCFVFGVLLLFFDWSMLDFLMKHLNCWILKRWFVVGSIDWFFKHMHSQFELWPKPHTRYIFEHMCSKLWNTHKNTNEKKIVLKHFTITYFFLFPLHMWQPAPWRPQLWQSPKNHNDPSHQKSLYIMAFLLCFYFFCWVSFFIYWKFVELSEFRQEKDRIIIVVTCDAW